MKRLQKHMLWLWCMLLPLATGCATFGQFGTSTQVYPSSLELDIRVEQLRQNARDYEVYYSGPKYNPSAILFVVQEQEALNLKLDQDWKVVLPGPDLEDLFWRIEMEKKHLVKLRAVVPPEEDMQTADNILAYIYSQDYASLRKTEEENTYYLQAVPEQYNPLYHDDGMLVDPGIRH
ncbi:hypothetical protein [Desulfovermiculus halophilus]|uniref:hypothetical protein n=1 Tax=Desulfovermiculus halophilus TaxID=339722 RepID=UPI001294693B|nr:hypothetical protein [Desulfovermiculus halophilus]